MKQNHRSQPKPGHIPASFIQSILDNDPEFKGIYAKAKIPPELVGYSKSDKIDASIRLLADALKENTHVATFCINGYDIDEQDMIYLLQTLALNRSITELEINNCNLSSDAITSALVVYLQNHATLKKVMLFNNGLINTFAEKLAASTNQVSFSEIDLRENDFNDHGIEKLIFWVSKNTSIETARISTQYHWDCGMSSGDIYIDSTLVNKLNDVLKLNRSFNSLNNMRIASIQDNVATKNIEMKNDTASDTSDTLIVSPSSPKKPSAHMAMNLYPPDKKIPAPVAEQVIAKQSTNGIYPDLSQYATYTANYEALSGFDMRPHVLSPVLSKPK